MPGNGKAASIFQARMAKGIHGLPKVSPRPTITDLSTPCGWVTCGRRLPPWILYDVRAWYISSDLPWRMVDLVASHRPVLARRAPLPSFPR
jgi:hypothetical protein